MSTPLQALVKWEKITNDLMDATRRFPKILRPTLGRRLDDTCIDALVRLSEARYLPRDVKADALRDVDKQLATARVLLRLARARDAVSGERYLLLSEQIDEVGRMIGGLRRAGAGTEQDPEPPAHPPAPPPRPPLRP